MNANQQVGIDIVEISGRTVEGIKFLGMVPEAIEADDFSIYIRWDGTKVTADRSDTDRNLVASHVTKTVGKVEALKRLFENLATFYGVPVTVQADPGVKVTAMAVKVLGTYAPRDMTPVAQVAFSPADPATWGYDNLPEGWSWVTVDEVNGEDHLFTPDGTDHTAAMEAARAAAWVKADKLITIPTGTSECACYSIFEQRQAGQVLPVGGLLCPSDGSVFTMEGTEPSESLVAAQQVILDANMLIFAAKRREQEEIDAADIAEANAQAWAEAGSPRDEAGQPFIPSALPIRTPQAVFTDHDMRDQVTIALGSDVADFDVPWIVECLQRVHGTVSIATIPAEAFWDVVWVHGSRNLDRAEAILTARADVAPSVVDYITKRRQTINAQAWDRAEAEIWAGTDQVTKMRFPRKLKKALRREFGNRVGVTSPSRLECKRARIARGW